MVPAFSDVAFALKPGEVSDVVTTQFGLHLIKVTDRKPAGTVPLEEVGPAGQGVPDGAEEAAAGAGLYRASPAEGQDRGPHLNEEVLSAAADALKRGESVALVTVVRARGSTPQRAGAKMLVYADGRTVGTIGGGCYENEACLKAREVLASGRQALMHFELNDDFAQENGLICGGQMDVHVDALEPAPRLYIIGAGHVGWHLARIADEIDFRVHVVDDREKFASRERFPAAEDSRRRAARRVAASGRHPGFVVRRHRHARAPGRPRSDARARAARPEVPRPDWQPRQGRAHSHRARRRGDALGVRSTACTPPSASTSAPITPAEIAVAILAELIAVRRGAAGGCQAVKIVNSRRGRRGARVEQCRAMSADTIIGLIPT